jgi:hypothetical protein
MAASLGWRSPRRVIPTRDRVLLSSWEKFTRYGRFPLKLVLHVSLVALTTWQVVRYNERDAGYVRAATRNFMYYFFPAEFDFSSRHYYLYTVDEVVSSVNRSVQQYDAITRTSVDQLSHPSGTCAFASPARSPEQCAMGLLEVSRYARPPRELFDHPGDLSDIDDDLVHEQFWINASSLGALEGAYPQVADYLQSVVEMRATYLLVAHGPRASGRGCLVWQVSLAYNFAQRGQMDLSLDSFIVGDCTEPISLWQMLGLRVHQINLALLLLSAWMLLLSARAIWRSFALLTKVEQRYERRRLALLEDFRVRAALAERDAELDRAAVLREAEAAAGLAEATASAAAAAAAREATLRRPGPPRSSSDAGATASARAIRHMLSSNEPAAVPQGSPAPVPASAGSHSPVTAGSTARAERVTDAAGSSGGVAVPRQYSELDIAPLSMTDKLRFFNLWLVLSLVASALNLSNALLGLSSNRQYAPPEIVRKLMLALGCSLLWVNLIAFLTHKPSYYTIVLTLGRAVPRVGRFVMGVIPIFLGYALFGMLYFGSWSERFGSLGLAMITLFSVLNGDVMRETFMDLLPFSPFVTQVYMYSFVSVFIYVVLNVFIAIVEESFFSTRAKARSLETFAKEVRAQEEHGADARLANTDSVATDEREREADVNSRGPVLRATFDDHNTPLLRTGYNTFGGATNAQRRFPAQQEPETGEQRRLAWFRHVLSDVGDDNDT